MTKVWQLSAAQECMDGMLLLIKEIFPPPWSLDISQILCCSYQFFCYLSDETWLSTLRLRWLQVYLEQHVKAAWQRRKGLVWIHSSVGNRTCALFWKWYKRPCVQLRSETSRSTRIEKLLARRLSVPQLMAVYIIYDAGMCLLIHGVSCPAGMCSCTVFDMLGNISVVIFLL